MVFMIIMILMIRVICVFFSAAAMFGLLIGADADFYVFHDHRDLNDPRDLRLFFLQLLCSLCS